MRHPLSAIAACVVFVGCDRAPEPETKRNEPSEAPSEAPRPAPETPVAQDEPPPAKTKPTWALEDQVLASVPGVSMPVPKGPVVYVAKDRVETGAKVLAEIDAEGNLGVGDLEPTEDSAVVNAEESVVFVIDERVRASVARKVVAASMEAGFMRHALVVQGGTAIELAPSEPSTVPKRILDVLVTPDLLVASGGNEPTRIDPLADGERDWVALATRMEQLRKAHPGIKHVWVHADDVDFGTLARTLAAARGPDCETKGDCLLPVLAHSSPRLNPEALEAEPSGQGSGLLATLAAENEEYGFGQSGIGPGSNGAAGPGTVGVVGTSVGGADEGGDEDSGEKVPRVLAKKISVKGSLDKDIIRRIVRRHIDEVRFCYSQGLSRDPALQGTLSIQFMINASGEVPVAILARSDLSDKDVGKCIARAFKRWKFPKTRGDVVNVTYPFELEPG